jgi:HSP20 family molecular chaperone IbpA
MDTSFHHFPLAVMASSPLAAQKSLALRGPFRADDFSSSSSDSDEMEVQEVIEVSDSDDEDDRVTRRSSIVDSGRKRKIRREVPRTQLVDKKRSRSEPELPSVEVTQNAAPPAASELPSVAKKSKPNSDEVFPMEVDESSIDLFGWKPVVSTTEHEDHFLVEAKLPGFSKDDVGIDLDEYEGSDSLYLKLIARKSVESKEPMESTSVKFTRLIPLPKSITAKDISAVWEDGSLKVSIKKPEQVEAPRQPVVIPVVDASAAN